MQKSLLWLPAEGCTNETNGYHYQEKELQSTKPAVSKENEKDSRI